MTQNPKFDTTFFERYAKISLTELVDNRFCLLQNRDRPDLQDDQNSVGIEVTRAIRECKEVAHALINKIAGRPIMDVSDEDWMDMTTYGYGYGLSDNIVGKIEYDYWATAMPMKRILDNKIHKVTDGFYGNFKTFGLYIFSKENLDNDKVQQTIRYAMDLQKNKKTKYTSMYISQIHEMFVCDLNNASFEPIEISKSLSRKFYKEAVKGEPVPTNLPKGDFQEKVER
ncbi:MAG: hypothetical protein LBV72_18915 [Tannerella sp.]|jgi:hypothetical protein|nr:hypothetical protein [Tannerella sp.]